MIQDFKKIIPPRFHNVSYEKDFDENTRKIIDEEIGKGNGLFIFGPTGVGKTHLAISIFKKLNEKFLVKFYNVAKLLEQMRLEYKKTDGNDEENEESLFWQILNFKNGFLILDDIGSEKMTEWARERLYLIIDEYYNNMLPIIFTSNHSLSILSEKTGDRIASRIIGMTKQIELDGVDKRFS